MRRPKEAATLGNAPVVVRGSFGGSDERRSLLDRAHRGDIEGAFGIVRVLDTSPRRTLRRRALTLLAVMGPGVVVMASDNDAGGISLYAQAGQDHMLRLLPIVAVLALVLFVNQEMVARLGAVTGAGHARLIFERFGQRWGTFALVDLLLLNFLTLVTEFIGVALAFRYFGITLVVSVPAAGLLLVAVTTAGSFRVWERAMYVLVVVSLLALPLIVLAHDTAQRSSFDIAAAAGAVRHSSFLLLVVALVGSTVAPWQLFFHQSNVVDKRITPRWLNYERVDVLVGTVLFAIGAVGVLLTCVWVLGQTGFAGRFVDAGATADALRAVGGPWVGALFVILLLDGSLLGAGAVTLSTSYAIGDVFGTKHSLHRRRRDARMFHGSFVALVALAAVVVLLPGVPLGLATVGVQALAGVLLPSATVFLLLLCNDDDVLGPHVNPRWLNAVAVAVVGVVIMLSLLLTATLLFPWIDDSALRVALGGAFAVVLIAAMVSAALGHRSGEQLADAARAKSTWTMPRLESLAPPRPSSGRRLGLALLRLYLASAVVLAALKVISLLRGA